MVVFVVGALPYFVGSFMWGVVVTEGMLELSCRRVVAWGGPLNDVVNAIEALQWAVMERYSMLRFLRKRKRADDRSEKC